MQNFPSLWPVPYPAFCANGGVDCESSCPCSLSIAKFWDEVPLVKLRVNGDQPYPPFRETFQNVLSAIFRGKKFETNSNRTIITTIVDDTVKTLIRVVHSKVLSRAIEKNTIFGLLLSANTNTLGKITSVSDLV